MSRNSIGFPHGDQALKVRMDEVRALGFLPRDVEIVGVINAESANPWVPKSDTTYLYLHIRGAICFDRPDGAALCIEPLFDFYDRYATLKTAWVSDLNHALSAYNGG